ncbi:fimbria/pilus outer membrane usher protein [Scandinavium goeteborgense]|uniref:fimbria/pilus outer membrane usher protein n=1 Tax=Scandinavium goeteborgense TaxID=1851514 RepID=UPI00380EF359
MDKNLIALTACKKEFPIKTSVRIVAAIIYSIIMIQRGWAVEVKVGTREQNVTSDPKVVEYDTGFIHGSGIDVSRYMKGNPVMPGVHSVYVIVDGQNRGRHDIHFSLAEGNDNAQPVFTQEELKTFGIRITELPEGISSPSSKESDDQRLPLKSVITDSHYSYDEGEFELDINVPQANLIALPRGYVDPARWDSGVTAGYVDYSANVYDSSSDSDQENLSGNLGMLLGFNVADWRFRKRLNTSWSQNDGTNTQNLYTYAQTDVTSLKSQLTLGDSTTTGDLFDSFTLRGAQLQSDDRMLPEGLRNYVPVLRGVAETNAKVTVTQHGQKIYEAVVPPGEFELNDIGAMGYGGDLQLTVTEADGRQRIQNIPFSAPPMLLHENVSRFSVSVGELNDDAINGSPKILETVYQRGLTSVYTVYGGVQLAEHYKSVGIGNSFNTPIGGFSLDVTHAKSELDNNKESSGNSVNVGYTKYLQETATNMTLAAYRYSSKGFYSFREASIERYGSQDAENGVDFRTKERFTAAVSQAVWAGSSLSLSASLYNYWDDRDAGKQYSATFSNTQRYFSWSLTAMRTDNGEGEYDNSMMVSLSVPLGHSYIEKPLFSSLYSTASHDDNGHNSIQTSANGSQGAQNELTYGVGTSVSGEHSADGQESVNGNINYRSAYGQQGITVSADNNSSRQFSLSANGSVVAHKGGVTLGPQLGDGPFAILGAEGADGAKVMNGYGSEIDSNGYAIVPSLTPYRENSVAIDSKGLPDTVDIMENERVIVPRMGAAIAVDMKTVVGEPMILIIRDQKHAYLPMGTELVDEKGDSQSLTGQGGMAFIRGWDPAVHSLFALLENHIRCQVIPEPKYEAKSTLINGSIVQKEMTCVR